MAKKKTPQSTKIDPEQVADAVIVSATPDTTDQPDPVAESEAVILDEPSPEESPADTAKDPETEPDQPSEAEETSEADLNAPAPHVETPSEPAPEAPEPATAAPAPVVVRKGGFLPLLLGGVAAAAIGFGAARYVLPEGWPWPGADMENEAIAALTTAQQEQSNRIAALNERIAGMTDAAEIAQAVERNGTTLTALTARLDAIETRLADLESRPAAPAGAVVDTSGLSAEIDALRSALAALSDAAAAQQKAEEMSARDALARAALNRVLTALDTGGDFSDALADLEATGISAPDALRAVAAGAPTQADLQSDFTDLARAALAAARDAGADETASGLGGFLRSQLGMRSLEPREGSDPNAILSRVEAAVRQGHLTDALAEIETLPDAAKAPLADWVAQATARQDALAAVQALGETVGGN